MSDVFDNSYVTLTDFQAILQSPPLFSGIAPEDIRVRQLPIAGERLDNKVPCCILCPYEDDQSKPLDFEGTANRIYKAQIVLIDFIAGDFATNQQMYQRWKALAKDKIERDNGDWRLHLPNSLKVLAIDILGDPTFDRGKLSEYYAYQGIIVQVQCNE